MYFKYLLYFNHFITLLLTLLNSKPGCKATAAELLTETAIYRRLVCHPKQTVCNELGAPVPYTH